MLHCVIILPIFITSLRKNSVSKQILATINHFLGIAAAQYTHRKYFKSQENYDRYYDAMVRVQKIGVEVIGEKAHDLIE